MEYEMEAEVSIQTEKYYDFWREIPVANTENKLNGKFDNGRHVFALLNVFKL